MSGDRRYGTGSHILGDAPNVCQGSQSKGNAHCYLPGLQFEALAPVLQQLPPIAACRGTHEASVMAGGQ